MIYHNQNKDHFPAQSLRERAACTRRFVEISGPEYLDRPGIVARHSKSFSTLTASNDTRYTVSPEDVSFASWYILRAAEPGETVILKMRVDDVASQTSR